METLSEGGAVLALLAALTADLFLLARVWRPLAGGARAWAARLARPFGAPDAVAAAACALIVALPAALTTGQARPAAAAAPPTPSAAALLLPALAVYALWCGAAVMCARLRGLRPRDAFFAGEPSRRPLANGVGLGAAMVIPVLALSVLSYELCAWCGLDDAQQDVFTLLREPALRPAARAAVIGMAVAGAPLAEETLFRGLLFPALLAHSRSFARALILQGLLFGAIHAHLPTFLPLSAAGVCFALGYAATGSLATPILMHAAFNASSILFFFAGGE